MHALMLPLCGFAVSPAAILAAGLAMLSVQALSAQQTEEQKRQEVIEGFDKAQKTLRSFLEAETWEEAAQYVLDQEHLEARMKRHYETYPWEPVKLEGIRYAGGAEVHGDDSYYTHDFQLAAAGKPMVIPVTMVQVGEEYRIDWEIFAQTYDGTFEEFLKGEDDEVRTFRVNMHRGVVLGEHESLGLDGGTIRLRAAWRPGIFFPGDFFAASNSEVGKKIEERVPWQEGAPFRVDLKWSKCEDGSDSFIEVVGLQSLNFSTPSLFD